MSSITANQEHAVATPAKVIQPAWVRIVHWINAVAMILMIMSGWQIYNASPLFDFKFSSAITLGGWLGGALIEIDAPRDRELRTGDMIGLHPRRYRIFAA